MIPMMNPTAAVTMDQIYKDYKLTGMALISHF